MVDGSLVFSKSYTRQTEDLASTDIDLSNYAPWKHTIIVQAIDANWKMNNDSIVDVLQLEDNDPPFIAESKKESTGNWNYKVTLIFDDHLSWIPWWTISVQWKVVERFEWRLASFTTSSETFDIEVKDNYWNILNQTMNLSDL